MRIQNPIYYFICFQLLIPLFLFAQDSTKTVVSKHSSISNNYIQYPKPQGGYKEYNSFIKENLKYPQDTNIQGAVVVSALLDSLGQFSNIFIISNNLDKYCGNEAMRIVKIMPKWIPRKENGKNVNSKINLLIEFKKNNLRDSIDEFNIENFVFNTSPENYKIQQRTDTTKKSNITFTTYDEPPVPPGGADGYRKFLQNNMTYPQDAINAGAQGYVYISITVSREGSLSNIYVETDGVGHGCAEEAMRVISSMPPWKPGKMNGVPVKVRYSIPVKFSFSGKKILKPYDTPPMHPFQNTDQEKAFLRDNLKYPESAVDAHVQGDVYVMFEVDKDGTLENVKLRKDDLGHGCGDEAIRIVKKMPKWKPALLNGKPVKAEYTIPITFKLP